MNSTAENATSAGGSPQPASGDRTRILLITGMSGAGKSAALKALEDVGYEAVDNLPLSLLSSLVTPSAVSRRPLAIGVDIRTRDFGIEAFRHEIDGLVSHADLEVRLLFLDCEDEALRRRFTETRRRHPLAHDRPVTDGIRHERRLLSPLRDRADQVIDTTDLGLNDLRRQLHGQFSLDAESSLALFVMSFAYRNGLPREADLVFDVRFLANPHYETELRPLTGMDKRVGEFISRDPGYAAFFDSLTGLLAPLLPRFSSEGKSYLTVAVGCTGGRHRSVFIAEQLASWLGAEGQHVSVAHRDMER
jgi:UPF0042 nucleotide-binding protein